MSFNGFVINAHISLQPAVIDSAGHEIRTFTQTEYSNFPFVNASFRFEFEISRELLLTRAVGGFLLDRRHLVEIDWFSWNIPAIDYSIDFKVIRSRASM